MSQNTLQNEAEKLLQSMREVPPHEHSEKLRPTDELLILNLAAKGKSQIEIAQIVGCHQSTVSRVQVKYEDTRPLARKRLEAGALKMADTVVNTKDPNVALKGLGKLDVVRDDKEVPSNTGIVINIGAPGSPIRLPDIGLSED